jgi:cytidine deaminase
MRDIRQSVVYLEFDSPEELPGCDRELLSKATEALANAYAPYSHFMVGAAVRMENGQVVTGSNQENMAFPSGLCAERVALFAAVTANPNIPVEAIAITARSPGFSVSEPVTPCGACRQSMIEYEMHFGRKIRLILRGESGKILVIDGAGSLLPLAFRENNLRKK